ncbi:MAG: hypothetical protein ABSH16_05815 [Sedimentisphaerales bacterium]
MTEQMTELTQKTEDLLGILELDIERIERTIQNLNNLRGLVVKRDEKELGRLLEAIQSESQVYSHNERQRDQLRKEMAKLIGCPQESMNLSVLKEHLSEPGLIEQVGDRQLKLRNLVMLLKKEYVSTVALLSDCARINSALLKCIFGRGQGKLVCYNSAGEIARQNDAAFMSMRM